MRLANIWMLNTWQADNTLPSTNQQNEKTKKKKWFVFIFSVPVFFFFAYRYKENTIAVEWRGRTVNIFNRFMHSDKRYSTQRLSSFIKIKSAMAIGGALGNLFFSLFLFILNVFRRYERVSTRREKERKLQWYIYSCVYIYIYFVKWTHWISRRQFRMRGHTSD